MELQGLHNHIIRTRFENAIQQLYLNKSRKKILLKIAEETNELSLAILQHLTKGSPEVNIQEEMIDVWMNLNLLAKFFEKQSTEEMLTRKVEKMIKVNDKYMKIDLNTFHKNG